MSPVHVLQMSPIQILQVLLIVLHLFFKFRFILVLACLKNYKCHDAKFCSVKCFEKVHVLQMSPVHVLQMSSVEFCSCTFIMIFMN